MCIEEKLSNIREYLISLRYEGKLSIIDVRFKSGWDVPKSKSIKVQKYPDLPDTYMFYCDIEGIKIDDIADYIAEVIRINLEREEKGDLLRVKIEELQMFFINTELEDLKRLKFEIEPVEHEVPYSDMMEDIAFPEAGEPNVDLDTEDLDTEDVKIED